MIVELVVIGSLGYVGVKQVMKRQRKRAFHILQTDGYTSAIQANDQPVHATQNERVRLITTRKAQANHFLAVSSVALGMSLIGHLLFPPLILLSLPFTAYSWYPLIKYGYDGLKEKKVNVGVVDAFLVAGLLFRGNIVLAGLTVWTLMIAERILVITEGDSHAKLVDLFGEQPQCVWVQKDGVDIEIPFDTLQIGDIVIAHAGERIPVDGVITQGVATIDQRMLTGESQPVEKAEGDPVYASTIVLGGRVGIRVIKEGQETVAAQIGQILDQTADFRESVRSRGRKVADDYAVPTLVIAALAGSMIGLRAAVAALVASFGYNLRVISPISVLNFLQVTSRHGILIKDGRSLELLRQVDVVVFDKTGTLTIEQPHVGNIHVCHTSSDDAASDIASREAELLTYAAAAEYKQSHPIAKAILAEASQRGLCLPSVDETTMEVGYGIKTRIGDQLIHVGSFRFMTMEQIPIEPAIAELQAHGYEEGYSLVYVAVNQQLYGAIELHPTLRPEAQSLIRTLHTQNLAVYIISGDHEQPTRKLAQALEIEHYFAEVLPEGKASIVEQLQAQGHFVCFIGDGINDSIALKQANVSISMSGATTIATDTAQVVLMDGDLTKLDFLFDIAHSYEKNMQQNFLSTMVPAVICVGGIFFLNFGVLSGVLLYNIGLLIGVGNAMSPLLRYPIDRTLRPEMLLTANHSTRKDTSAP